jgi:hypothetical protein
MKLAHALAISSFVTGLLLANFPAIAALGENTAGRQFTGTRWQIFEVSQGVVGLKCLGNVDGPRWLDGRTGQGTVGLAPNTPTPDGGFSGAAWKVYSA